MIRAFKMKLPTNQFETLTQSSVEQFKRSEPDPDPLINIPFSERMVCIKLELDGDSSQGAELMIFSYHVKKMEEDFNFIRFKNKN